MKIKFDDIFPAEITLVQGKQYLFSNLRVDRESIPKDLYAYDVGDDCDGEFWRIQNFVLVNHWATIIGTKPINLDENGQYWCPPMEDDPDTSSEGWFVGAADSLREYIERSERM
jgi:hypothetical protein